LQSALKSLVYLTKPRLTALLALTSFVGALAAYNGNHTMLFTLVVAVLLSCMGTNALTCYIDKDMDTIMERTMNRPLPTKRIGPQSALAFGSVLLALGVLLAASINVYVVSWALIGSALVLSYNKWFKKATPYSILIASPGGAAPLLGAYSAMTGAAISIQPLLLALLIVFWTPLHIWSIALSYKEDYRRAGVPMLPVVRKDRNVVRSIALFAALYIADTSVLFLMLEPSWLCLLILTLINYPLLKSLFQILFNDSIIASLRLFKLSSPHLGVIFILYLVLSTRSSFVWLFVNSLR
jgi:protoheme IX farnesyltransferase